MAKKIYVQFDKRGARVWVNRRPPGHDYLENPDLSRVMGIPPHKWRRWGDKVVPAWGWQEMAWTSRPKRIRIIMTSMLIGMSIGTIIGVLIHAHLY